MRFDRVIVLILRIVACVPICYIGLQGMNFEDLEQIEQQEMSLDDIEMLKTQLNLLYTCLAVCILLLPLPSQIFNSCRVKYRLLNEVLSQEVPQEKKQKEIYINSNLSICQLMKINSLPYDKIGESLLTKVKKMSRVQLE